jgi:hypothetical protein
MNIMQGRRALEAEQSYDGDVMRDFISGATCRRRIEIGGVTFPRGATLTRQQVIDIAPRNLRAMVLNRILEVRLGPQAKE